MEDRPEVFGYQINNQAELSKYKKLPENCALGVVNLTITDGDSSNNNTVQKNGLNEIPNLHTFCAACKEGYKPTNINNLYFFIKVKCTEIENCDGQNWFNSCS